MPNRLPISVCLISGAEAHRIGRALESVAAWTSEIIVVLNEEVRDGTEDIAARYGAKVFRERWKGHIAQKNSAAEKATQPWSMGLDADEVVSQELRTEITELFDDEARLAAHAAFGFPRRTFFCGRWIRHGDWYPDRQTRLWRKGFAQWGGIDPHDKLMVKGRVGRLHSDLLHFSNESIARQIDKIAPYQVEIVKRRVAAGKSAGFFELVCRPLWRFVRAYFLRLGFLDGWPGYYIAWMNAFSTVTRYAKVLEARTEQRETKP